MSEQIKVGDLVVVVRPRCSTELIGTIFRVASLCPLESPCLTCGTTHGHPLGFLMACNSSYSMRFEIDRLRRIPPLSELESTQEEAVCKIS